MRVSFPRRLVRAAAHRALGPSRVRHIRLRATDWKRLAEYRTLPDGRRSLRELSDYRDRYRGERCVIIGNGPSLREMDLSPLASEFTFGLNRIYLMFDEIGFRTSFLVVVNKYVAEQCGPEIADAGVPTFVSWHARRHMPAGTAPTYLCTIRRPGFTHDVRNGLWAGATVTYVALQLAYHMGFQEAVLIGVDHSFATTGTPNALVVSAGDDPNHFDPAYFGKGFRWQLPDLDTSEIAYEMARRAFASAGRRIVDATVDGKLQIFPKVSYAELFRTAESSAADSQRSGLHLGEVRPSRG
jgi:hypothetical protein